MKKLLLTIAIVTTMWSLLVLDGRPAQAGMAIYYRNVCAWSITAQCSKMRANGTAHKAGKNWARRNGYSGYER